MKRWQAIFALLVVVVIWGSTFLIVHDTTKTTSVLSLLFYRFSLGALVMLPFSRAALRGLSSASLLRGVSLGALLFVSFVAQTAGLSMTSASRGGFITGLNVVLVPVLGSLFFRTKISRASWVGGFLSFVGLFSLTRCSGEGGASWLGDLLVLLCAVTFAGHIIAVERVVKSASVISLNLIQLLTVASLSLFGSLFSGGPPIPSFDAFVALAYLGAIASAFILALQLPAQRVVSATETALIFSLEPVFAALFAVVFGGESLCLWFWIGGSLMLLGILLCELGSTKPRAETTS